MWSIMRNSFGNVKKTRLKNESQKQLEKEEQKKRRREQREEKQSKVFALDSIK